MYEYTRSAFRISLQNLTWKTIFLIVWLWISKNFSVKTFQYYTKLGRNFIHYVIKSFSHPAANENFMFKIFKTVLVQLGFLSRKWRVVSIFKLDKYHFENCEEEVLVQSLMSKFFWYSPKHSRNFIRPNFRVHQSNIQTTNVFLTTNSNWRIFFFFQLWGRNARSWK